MRLQLGATSLDQHFPKRGKFWQRCHIAFIRDGDHALVMRIGALASVLLYCNSTRQTMEVLKDVSAIALANSLPDGVFLVDERGRIRHANAAWEDILGYRPSDLLGQTMLELVAPDDRDRTQKQAGRVQAGIKCTGFENRYRHQLGTDVHLSWSAQWNVEHRLRIGVARNVTATRTAAEHSPLAQLQARLAPHESRVLQLLLTEAAEKQIAEQLGLATSTTHSYITSVYRKFGVRGRAGLMSLWLKEMQSR
ncbi:PAS domain S-box protein [Ralstonia edaphi]|uniref:PAS domain S-box protein n=1 Tax=Ralstonia edaphi TaxID=3058599 RepID=UPI00292CD78A|nr:PAS domain S-box protein [Ralstonia sp. LMG 6871]